MIHPAANRLNCLNSTGPETTISTRPVRPRGPQGSLTASFSGLLIAFVLSKHTSSMKKSPLTIDRCRQCSIYCVSNLVVKIGCALLVMTDRNRSFDSASFDKLRTGISTSTGVLFFEVLALPTGNNIIKVSSPATNHKRFIVLSLTVAPFKLCQNPILTNSYLPAFW